MKYVVITLILTQKNNRMKQIYNHEKTFNKLYNDYITRSRKKEKMKNYYFMNESESYPFSPKFAHSGYFAYPGRVMPSLNNFGKKYYSNSEFRNIYNQKLNYSSKIQDYNKRKNITDYDKIFEEKKYCYNSLNNLKKGIIQRYPRNNRKTLSSRLSNDFNDQISHYLSNLDLGKKQNILYKNIANKKDLFNNNFNSEKKNLIKSQNKSKEKIEKKNKNKNKCNELIYNSNKSLNPSSLNGIEQIQTNYTYPQRNSNFNIKSANGILSNVNSVSSKINETNNNSHFLNGIKIMSGVNEYFYDINPDHNRNINNNFEQKGDLALQTLSDSKMLELAGKYINDDDNSSENYQMNNILHSKKKYRNRIYQ